MSSNDLALLQRWVAERNAEAFAEVATRYAGMVYGACRRVLGDAGDAEDVAQECFVALAQTASPPRSNLAAWLHRVAVNKARDHVRKTARQRRRETHYQQEHPAAVEIEWHDIESLVDDAIAKLPDEAREVLVAHFMLGQTHAEIAARLGVSRQTVTHRIGQGIDLVRTDLAKRGIGVTASALALCLAANMAEAAPATLVAALGKLAVSGIPAAIGGTALGGLVSTKAAMTGIVVIFLIGIASVVAFQVNRAPALPSAVVSADNSALSVHPANNTDAPSSEQANPARNAAKPGGLPSVQIVDQETKKPVSGLDVIFYQYGVEWKLEGKSDAKGRVAIPALAPGDYRVMLQRSAYYLAGGAPTYEGGDDLRKVRFSVDAKGVCPPVQVEVVRGATVSGRVFDERRNEPVTAVHLDAFREFRGMSVRWAYDAIGLPALTDDRGVYLLEGLPPGHFEIVCWCPGRKAHHLPINVSPACDPIDTLDFAVDLGVHVSGRVTDATGQPVPDATVRGAARAEGDLKVDECQTAADGSFTLYGFMQNGRLFVQASKESAISDIAGPFELASDVKDVAITLEPGPTISGLVVSRNGKPVAGAQLYAFYLPENFPVEGRRDERGIYHGDLGYGVDATANADGSFQFQGLSPGFYGLNAKGPKELPSSSGDMSYLKRVEIQRDSHLLDLRLVLGQPEVDGLSIKGRVTSEDGRPLPGARVTASQVINSWNATSDAAGNFSITGLPKGDFQVSAFSADHGKSEIVTVPAGSTDVALSLQGSATVQGHVVDAVTSKPVARFHFLCQEEQRPLSPGFLGGAGFAFTDGEYSMGGQDVGPNELYIWAPGYVLAHESFELRPGEAKRIDIRLQPTPPLKGIVVDEQGAPVAAANVYLQFPEVSAGLSYDRLQHGSQWRDATTDATGNFVIETLVPNPPKVLVIKEGYALGSAEMPQGADLTQPLTIVLGVGGTVEGHLTFESQPPSDVSAYIFLKEEASEGEPRQAQCDPEGRYQFEHVTYGDASADIWVEKKSDSTGRRSFSRTVHVAAGATSPVDFDLPIYTGSLQGAITIGGKPPKEGQVIASWTSPAGEAETAQISCNGEGNYVLESLPQARIGIRVYAINEGGVVGNDFDADVTSGQPQQMDFAL
ncbi:MAG: sigma-70 family RNA polymerase sigma factor [Candidatus Hydrogenedentales bacterium]|jgi:RNA polymerase sigma factor (sigma-70 family)